MLSRNEKDDIYRHLGYETIAVNRYGQSVGQVRQYKINQTLAPYESRLDELSPTAESKLTGACIGFVSVIGLDPVAGNTVSLTFNSEDLDDPEVINFTAATDMKRFDMATKIAMLINSNVNLGQARIVTAGPWHGGIDPNLSPEIEFKAPNPFTLTTTYTGLAGLSIIQHGEHVEPSAILAKSLGVATTKYGYLPICNFLASAVAGVTRNADVSRAGTYSRGKELRERIDILNFWRNELSSFLGIPRNGSQREC